MKGFHCQITDSSVLKCHFVLANYVCDLPEAWDLLGVKGQTVAFHVIGVLYSASIYLKRLQAGSVKETKHCREEGK